MGFRTIPSGCPAQQRLFFFTFLFTSVLCLLAAWRCLPSTQWQEHDSTSSITCRNWCPLSILQTQSLFSTMPDTCCVRRNPVVQFIMFLFNIHHWDLWIPAIKCTMVEIKTSNHVFNDHFHIFAVDTEKLHLDLLNKVSWKQATPEVTFITLVYIWTK